MLHPRRRTTLFPYTTLFRSLLEQSMLQRLGFLRWVDVLWLVLNSSRFSRSEEHTSELQSLRHLVCRLLLEKKKRAGMAVDAGGLVRRVDDGGLVDLLGGFF